MTREEAIKLLQGSILDVTEEVKSYILDDYLYISYRVKVVDAEILLFWELNIDLNGIYSWNGSHGLKRVIENRISNYGYYGLAGISLVK